MDNLINAKIKVEDMILEVNGKQVMIDSDLAKLYQCKNGTKEINQAVKNNLEKFPERFSWILSEEESLNLRSKILTSSLESSNHGGRRYNIRVFTEQGVAMLATILKSKIAVEVSIRIMDAFVLMRHFTNENKDIYYSLNKINNELAQHDEKINYIFSKFDKKEQLFLPGEVYSAYSEILNILNDSEKEVIIIDAYADKTLLDFIKDIDSKIVLITSNKSRLEDVIISKFNKQYNKLKVVRNNKLHDRYIIIDRKNVYHIGTSLNHVGEKMFSLNKLDDEIIKETLINYVTLIIEK